MKRMVLLDANLLIGAFDHDCENPRHVQARQHMAQLLNDPEIRLANLSLFVLKIFLKICMVLSIL